MNRIEFEKPDILELRKKYTVVDMHFHTNYSDGHNTVKTIARRLSELGIGAAITDHNEIAGAIEMDAYKDVLSIPGIEITSLEGTHLLVYFYDIDSLSRFYEKDLKPFMGNDIMSSTSLPMEEIIKLARKYHTVIIFPHPYCAAYTGIYNPYFSEERRNRLYHMIDGVEVINSGNLNKWNLRSSVLGFNLGRCVTGGSDGHKLSHIGKAVTYSECDFDRKAFLDAIRNRSNRVIGKEIDILRKVTSNSSKLRSNLKNYPDLMEKNLKYGVTVINNKSRLIRDNFRRNLNGKLLKWRKA